MTARLMENVDAAEVLVGRMLRRIEALGLDLRGRTVLTEAATGPYVVTPLVAALAGAEVIALARDSRYATAEEASRRIARVLEAPGMGDAGERVQLVRTLTPGLIRRADLVTNSGHLRPLDREKLQHVASSAVIALMFEDWEWRPGDLDLEVLRERGIRVVATDEQHPDVDVFGYLGEMAVRLVHEAGRCLHNSRVVVVTNNTFGPYLVRTLAALAREVAVIDESGHRDRYAGLPVTWLGNLGSTLETARFRDSEAVLTALYPFEQTWFGDDGPLSARALRDGFDRPLVLRFAGHVDTAALSRVGVCYFPAVVTPGHMGVLPSALGDEPIVRLQAGGLRAGQAALDGDFLVAGHPIGGLMTWKP